LAGGRAGGASAPAAGGADAPSPAAARPPPLPVPDGAVAGIRRIGRYEVNDLIGRGGMGEVYRCRDPMIGRAVAIKVLRPGTERPGRTAELIARFQREAAAAGALQHPGIVAVHDLGHDQQLALWFIVLELVEGRSFDRVLEQRAPLPPAEAVAIGFQIADALAFAHARGVVHRDVKPANVLLRSDGSIKLLDFGLAAMQGSDLTHSGQVFGSPSYMAPERIRGKSGDAAVDQFSLGVMLYEALVGTNPFDGETNEARMVATLQFRPERADRRVPDLPPRLGAAIDRMMSKKAADRFPSMDDVVVELARVGRDLRLSLVRYEGPEGG
ncbi:MAG: serine/threonine protein kinase, partial [Deltaproteobacteria bacterium]|nr:serine/threonine protein kinase [Deltaproteobacteria bacterium]